MAKETYMQFVYNKIVGFEPGDPILIQTLGKELAEKYGIDYKKANANVSVVIKRIIKNGTIPALRCFAGGTYYLAKQTVFGETGINKEKLIRIRYLNGDNGYETGATIMHKIGLTSMMPAQRVIVSNIKKRTITDEKLDIVVKAPKTTVTRGNWKYLQFLDLLNIYDEVPIDIEEPYAVLCAFVKKHGLDYGKLLNIASLHYNTDTIIKLANVARNLEE